MRPLARAAPRPPHPSQGTYFASSNLSISAKLVKPRSSVAGSRWRQCGGVSDLSRRQLARELCLSWHTRARAWCTHPAHADRQEASVCRAVNPLSRVGRAAARHAARNPNGVVLARLQGPGFRVWPVYRARGWPVYVINYEAQGWPVYGARVSGCGPFTWPLFGESQ